MAERCPCTSGLPYRECCGPFLRGEREAPTPEALMRSRFAAYARGDAEYLWRTLHPDHEDRGRPRDEVMRELRDASRGYRYVRLAILAADGENVTFRAGVFQKGADRSFVERSRFARDGGGWRYLSGEPGDEPLSGSKPGQDTTGSRG